MKNRVMDLLKFLIGWPLSILALFFIFKLIAPQAATLFSNLHDIYYPLLTAGIFCFLTYYFLRGYIWKILIQLIGHEISFKDANFIWSSSELKRYIPGNIWSFVGRTVLFAERGVSKKDIARCSIIEVELFTLSGLAVSLLSLPFLTYFGLFPTNLATFVPWIIIGILLLYIFHKHFKFGHFILPDFKPQEILYLLFLNTILIFLFGLGYYFVIASLSFIDPNLIWQITGFSVLALLIGYLSIITPSGFGVREGALIFGLSKIMSISMAGFAAIVSRLTLIISELIFVLIAYLWYKTKNKKIIQLETWIGNHKYEVILFVLFLIYILYFSTITFLRYDNFYAGRFDLGNMSQTVWNTTKGRIFTMTNANGTDIVSRLSVHADFILILLAPFYTLWADPRNLLFIQTFILAFGCFFVYLIANNILKNKNLAFIFAFIYLINPSIERSNLYDFHAQTLATTFLLGAFYFFLKKRYLSFLGFSILAGLCKEQIWLIIAVFGIFLFFWHKKRIFGALVFTLCTLLSYFLISYAIPHALKSQHFALTYYADFGDSPLNIIKNILLSPQKTIGILLQPDRINYLKQLFLPLGYLSLLGPIFLIFAAPDLIIDLLSNNTQLHQIYYQYTATITPFLFISAIYGVALLLEIENGKWKIVKTMRYTPYVIPIITIYIVSTSLYSAYHFGPLPGSKEPNLDMITKPVTDRAFINTYLSNIHKRYSVAASNNIGSHLSQRQKIYTLPLGVDKADIIVFLLNESEFPDSLSQEKKLVTQLRKDKNYQLNIDKGQFIVFQKVIK